jgi:hypothetical protein
MVIDLDAAVKVERELWQDFLVREHGERLGAARGRRLREEEAEELAAMQPGPISREHVARDAWYEAVARAHIEAAAEVRVRHMPRAEAFAEAYAKGFMRAYSGGALAAGRSSSWAPLASQ